MIEHTITLIDRWGEDLEHDVRIVCTCGAEWTGGMNTVFEGAKGHLRQVVKARRREREREESMPPPPVVPPGGVTAATARVLGAIFGGYDVETASWTDEELRLKAERAARKLEGA